MMHLCFLSLPLIWSSCAWNCYNDIFWMNSGLQISWRITWIYGRQLEKIFCMICASSLIRVRAIHVKNSFVFGYLQSTQRRLISVGGYWCTSQNVHGLTLPLILIGLQESALQKFIRVPYIYPNFWHTLTPNRNCPKILTSSFYYLWMYLKTAGGVANSVDPDQMPYSVTSDLGLHCLLGYLG